MSLISNWFGKKGLEVYEYDNYEIKNIGNIVIPEKLSHKNAFLIANSVPEIHFPIDFYADRISKLRFYIANAKTLVEIPNTELNRFVTDSVNPLFSFSDLVYAYVSSLNADGNAYSYLGVPSIFGKEPTVNNIERWDVLQPNLVEISEIDRVSLLYISNLNELIKKVEYNDNTIGTNYLNVNQLRIDNLSTKRRSNSSILSDSILWKSNKSIDTLLAVYSARYNVYANNGMAGILAKKQNAQNSEFIQSISDSSGREDIIKDINSRNGIIGKKNIWGISGVPVEFVKTLATISELMPLEETLEASIKIASTMQIPPVLVPRKDQSTYDNQENAEKVVWENGLLSMAQTVAQNLTRLFGLDKANAVIRFDTSNVSALKANETTQEDLITKKLANIEKMKALNSELDTTELINNIYNQYGKE